MTKSTLRNKAPRPLAILIAMAGAGAIRIALPNVARPGLLRKPLDTTIERLLTTYCRAAARVTINKTTMQNTPTLLAV